LIRKLSEDMMEMDEEEEIDIESFDSKTKLFK